MAALSVDLSGKVACVTGASSGLGRACADALSEAGAKVVGVARREPELRHWSGQCAGETAIVSADLAAPPETMPAIAEAVANHFGPPDILVNAAGINPRKSADEVTPEVWNRTIGLNLGTPFFLAREMVPAMRQRRWGRIVNFASLQSERAMPAGIAYGASKAGIAQLTRAMAEAWSADGVIVNALAPGFFRTELTRAVFDEPGRADVLARRTCIGRNGEPDDLVGPLLFLCSDAARYVTGQLLYVDGGFTAK